MFLISGACGKNANTNIKNTKITISNNQEEDFKKQNINHSLFDNTIIDSSFYEEKKDVINQSFLSTELHSNSIFATDMYKSTSDQSGSIQYLKDKIELLKEIDINNLDNDLEEHIKKINDDIKNKKSSNNTNKLSMLKKIKNTKGDKLDYLNETKKDLEEQLAFIQEYVKFKQAFNVEGLSKDLSKDLWSTFKRIHKKLNFDFDYKIFADFRSKFKENKIGNSSVDSFVDLTKSLKTLNIDRYIKFILSCKKSKIISSLISDTEPALRSRFITLTRELADFDIDNYVNFAKALNAKGKTLDSVKYYSDFMKKYKENIDNIDEDIKKLDDQISVFDKKKIKKDSSLTSLKDQKTALEVFKNVLSGNISNLSLSYKYGIENSFLASADSFSTKNSKNINKSLSSVFDEDINATIIDEANPQLEYK
jgi:hypothetical protein